VRSASGQRAATVLLMTVVIGNADAAEVVNGRWALSPFACDGEAFTRPETPLLVSASSVRWFDTNCTVVSNYKVNETLYLQGRCLIESRIATIPIMLEPHGNQLRVGWNREPILEMQRCR
jgi:hypothetical protein